MVSDVMEQILKKVYLSMSYWQNEIANQFLKIENKVKKKFHRKDPATGNKNHKSVWILWHTYVVNT